MQSMNLTNHFLIAMPAMDDPYFSRSLIYIAEHNDQGALGLIVNRPIELNLAALFEKIDVPLEAPMSASSPSISAARCRPIVASSCIVLARQLAIDAGRDAGAWTDEFARRSAGARPGGRAG
jgi:putative AlgH/UPF0301 family transcriptional regulator